MTHTHGRAAAGLAVAIVAVLGAAFLITPATAETLDPRVAEAQAQVQAYCTDLKDDATTTRQGNTRADLCTMWKRELEDRTAVTPSPTQSPTASPTASPTSSPTAPAGYPTSSNTGVPAGWVPRATYSSNIYLNTPGQILEDVRLVNASIIVTARDVVIRRVEIQGGRIDNGPTDDCFGGMVLEDVSLIRAPGQVTRWSDPPAVQFGGYTARRVKIDGLPEGFRAAGEDWRTKCGPVTVVDSFARVRPPDDCGGPYDWHGDALQGYHGGAVTVRHSTLVLLERDGCYGTSAFFVPPNQGNTSAVVDDVLVMGGAYPFRLGVSGSVSRLRVATPFASDGPLYEMRCDLLTWADNSVVQVDSSFTVSSTVRSLACR